MPTRPPHTRPPGAWGLQLLVLLALCLACTSQRDLVSLPPAGEAELGTVLVFSDPHFDPLRDPSRLEALLAAEVGEWPGLLAGSGEGLGTYGEDTSVELLASSLDAMRAVVPRPDLVMITGDFLVHDLAAHFAELATEDQRDQLPRLIEKTFAFLRAEISRRFPGTPILPVLGNNDSVCGNYRLQPGGPFLARLAEEWQHFLPVPQRDAFLRTFPQAGHHVLDVPGSAHRVVVLNTVLFSRLYRNACGEPSDDPAGAAFGWLEAELERARRDARRVWLVFHIPPGIDTYQTLKQAREKPAADGSVEPVFFWHLEHHRRFVELIARHRETVVASIGGHIHRDSFQLLGQRAGEAHAAGFVRLVPSLSAVYDNNPGFQVWRYDREDGGLVDYQTHTLDLTDPARGWRLEYTFSQTYGHSSVDVRTLGEIYYRMLADPQTLETFGRFHSLSSPEPEMNGDNWPAYWAAIGQLEPASFKAWYRTLSRPSTPAE